MKRKPLIFGISVLFLAGALAWGGQKDGDDIVVGKYRKLFSKTTNEERTLLVWLPRSYQESSLSYPVLYLLYGQNLPVYLLPAITACDLLSVSGAAPEMIIVGVASAERYRDYSSIAEGYIENTVRFFRDELLPFIDGQYRTKSYRIVVGPQAGAVFSFYALLKYPDLFQAYILENPFVGQNREILLEMAKTRLQGDASLDRFLFIREEKSNNPLSVQAATQFGEMMKAGAPREFRFHFALVEPSGYFVPPAPVKEGLQKLFESFVFPAALKVQGLPDILGFFRNAGEKLGVDLSAPEHVLTMESDKLLTARMYDKVAEVLTYQLSLYPRSLNALMRMGDLKRTLGDYREAIRYYDEFLKVRGVDAIAIRDRRNGLEKYVNESLVFQLEKDIEALGIDRAARNFKRTKSSAENNRMYPETDFSSLGYALLNRGKVKESMAVFRLGVETYPRSANLYDSLGEACVAAGDVKNAIKNYETSLRLNPGNANAKEKLEQLRKSKSPK
jgi:hypothetical protein